VTPTPAGLHPSFPALVISRTEPAQQYAGRDCKNCKISMTSSAYDAVKQLAAAEKTSDVLCIFSYQFYDVYTL